MGVMFTSAFKTSHYRKRYVQKGGEKVFNLKILEKFSTWDSISLTEGLKNVIRKQTQFMVMASKF